MVSSLDGMIAKKDNSISWFETTDVYEDGVTGQNPEEFLKTIDCYVMGSRTYEHALELSRSYGWAYGHTPVLVMTNRRFPEEIPGVTFCSDSLDILVNRRLEQTYKNVWVVGGPELVMNFIRLNLADEIRLSILPIVLGDGIPFLKDLSKEVLLHLLNVTAYKNGMVELHYAIKKPLL